MAVGHGKLHGPDCGGASWQASHPHRKPLCRGGASRPGGGGGGGGGVNGTAGAHPRRGRLTGAGARPRQGWSLPASGRSLPCLELARTEVGPRRGCSLVLVGVESLGLEVALVGAELAEAEAHPCRGWSSPSPRLSSPSPFFLAEREG
jgi:hypothetical protein